MTRPIFGPLGVRFNTGLFLRADIKLGVDTYGLEQFVLSDDPLDIINGVYVSDNIQPDGSDPPEVILDGELSAAASLSAVVFEFGAGGGVFSDIVGNLRDPNGDGVARWDELQMALDAGSPICMFDVSGSIFGSLFAFVRIGIDLPIVGFVGFEQRFDLATKTIEDFSDACSFTDPPVLGSLDTITGELTANMGPNAALRINGDTSDGDEKFRIRKGPTGGIVIEAFGAKSDEFLAVSKVIARAGAGNDTILVDDDVLVPVELYGDAGSDILEGGGGPANIYGGPDADQLTAALVSSTLFGEAGDDLLVGGPEGDTLDGGAGNDILHGYGGIDDLSGGDDDDQLFGGDDNDNLDGGAGIDQLNGGAGADKMFGGPDNDILVGEAGNDEMHGEGGADILTGDEGEDTLHGDGGDDFLDGGDDADTLFGEAGNDVLVGGAGPDLLDGGTENDDLMGDRGSPEESAGLAGASENDVLMGGSGLDTLTGGFGDDDLFGGLGNDVLYGGFFESGGGLIEEINTLHGNENDDTLYGDVGNDLLFGDEDNDRIFGLGGIDQIFAGSGDDTVGAGPGNDFIFGGPGTDVLNGATGDDYIQSDEGSDEVYGGLGTDLLVQTVDADQTLTNASLSGQSTDTLSGIERVELTGGPGDNVFDVSGWDQRPVLIDGQGGTDTIVSSNDTDFLLSDWNLSRNDGASFGLTSIELALLTGGAMDNTFEFDQWTGTATFDGSGGMDRIISSQDGNYTLTDATLTRPGGDPVSLVNIDRAEITGGAGNNTIDASGFSGQARFFGRDGQDTLIGGSGDDLLDGGTGTDILTGNAGDDELRGGGGTGDDLDGGAGDDILRGSDDGADIIAGGAGRDIVFANGGNDEVSGGPGADTIDGGPGDDRIAGDGGSDIIIGAGDHDTVYGHNQASVGDGTADDGAVDYLYGDFGTNGNEPGSGQDQLFGGGGNDLLFGEGLDDFIDVGGGTGNLVDYGSGEAADPAAFTPPAPTAPPALGPPDVDVPAPATLPVGVDYFGRWAERAGSATGGGVSGGTSQSIEPVVAAGTAGTYVAWADNRSGNFEIYVARHTASGWEELAGSARDGGISASDNASRRPSVVLGDDGQPVVAWTEFDAAMTSSDIQVARFNPAGGGGAGAWEALGDSLTSGGISDTGMADRAEVVTTSSGPVVAYLNDNAGIVNVYVERFSGGNWSALAAGAASGDGISNSATDVSDLALATDGTLIAAAWTQDVTGTNQIYLRQYGGTSWDPLSGSASGSGLSNTAGDSEAASLAYQGGSLFAAWQTRVAGDFEIYAARHNIGWVAAGAGALTAGGVSNGEGEATRPQLAAGGGALHLVWADDRIAGLDGNTTSIYAKRWSGSAFVESLPGDARGGGIHPHYSVPTDLALSVDPSGQPFVAFGDLASGVPQVYVRGDTAALGTIYYVNDSSLVDDIYTSAVGNNANSALLPSQPKASIQDVLITYDLEPGDVILVDTGTYSAAATVSSADAGVTIQGASDESSSVTGLLSVTSADNVVLRQLDLAGGASITNSDNALLAYNTGGSAAGVTVDGGSNVQVVHNLLGPDGAGLTLSGALVAAVIEHNTIDVAGTGVSIAAGDVSLRDNRIAGQAAGIALTGAATGVITDNTIASANTGLSIDAAYSGSLQILANNIRDSLVGLAYDAAAILGANRIFNNATGVVATVDGDTDAFGFVAGGGTNEIFDNITGVNLNGRMQNQYIHNNTTTGVTGSGLLGPNSDDFDNANRIEANTTGADFDGTIQFNQISRNGTGVLARSGQLISHNLINENTVVGVHVSGQTDVRVVNNTMVASQGDNIRVEGGASEVEVRNNILWAEGGYDLFVANDSQTGFFSDYNDLVASGTGKLVFWTKDFDDILDWQADVARFDLNSIGRTVVDPQWAEPRFFNKALGDYRIFDLAAGQRFTSPTIDAGDPLADLALPAVYQNLLANADFEDGVNGWNTSLDAATQSSNPKPFFGGSYFYSANIAEGSAEQTIDLLAAGFLAADLDSQDLQVHFGGRMRSAGESAVDKGRLVVTFFDDTATPIGDPIVVEADNTTERWELVGQRLPLPAGTRSIAYRFEADRNTGTSNDAYLDRAFLYVLDDTVMPNQGAYGNTVAEAAGFGGPKIALRSPDLYVDWERDRPRTIRWDSFNNDIDAALQIDLYQQGPDGPEFLLNITPGTADDGEFVWTPFVDSGVDFGTLGLRIHLSLVGNQAVYDRSAETFNVPEGGNDYYVNVQDDGDPGDNEFTTASGSNRNTGKLPESPKPNPINVLRVYELTSGATLSIDPGLYPLIDTVSLSGQTDYGLGTDRGFTMTGPSLAVAEFVTAIPNNTSQALIFMDDADLMTIRNLTLRGGAYGIRATNGSTGLVAEDLVVRGSDQHGILIETSSSFNSLADITVSDVTTFDGLRIVGGAGGTISNLTSFNNRYGLFSSSNVSALDINGADLFANSTAGLNQDGSATSGTWSALLVHDNAAGIESEGSINLAGAVVFSNFNTGISHGISAPMVISDSEVFGNNRGVYLRNGQIQDSLIYGNAGEGIFTDWSALTLTGNKIYSNQYGLRSTAFTGAFDLKNNLFYDHEIAAIRLTGSGPSANKIVNNTIYEPSADAIRATNGVKNLELRNNVIWTEAGYGIFVSDDSQTGYQSDFNLLHATGTGKVGFWQGDRDTLTAWRFATFQDEESLSADPLFVDRDGADDILGAQFLVAGGTFSDGKDDNFHVESLFGSFDPGTQTFIPNSSQSQAIDRGDPADSFANEPADNGGFINLGAFGNTVEASKSPAQYVLITNPVGGENLPQDANFQLRWRSDGFAGDVRIEYSTSGTGGPFLVLADNETNDGTFDWFIDQVTFPLSNLYAIRITSIDDSGVSETSAVFSVVEPITAYFVNDASTAGDVQFGPLPGVWNAGDDANDGLTPFTPKASVRAVLQQYDLEFGDVIYVNVGQFDLTTNILIEHEDSGVRIEGPGGENNRVVLDRGNTTSGAYAFELVDADVVTLRNLQITGGQIGVQVGSASELFTLENSVVFENDDYGVNISDAGSSGAVIRDSVFYGDVAAGDARNQDYGLRSFGSSITVIGNEAYHTNGRGAYGIFIDNAGTGVVVQDNVAYNNSSTGIYVDAQQFEVSGNTARDNNDGFYLQDPNAFNQSQSFNNVALNNTTRGFRFVQFGEHFLNESHHNATGVFADINFAGVVHDSEAWANTTGFNIQSGTLADSRAYGNSGDGIFSGWGGITIQGNASYNNASGINLQTFTGTNLVENNLFYKNSGRGIRVNTGGGTTRVTNNTVLELDATAFEGVGSSQNYSLKNNILWAGGADHYAISVANSAQRDFASDYNLLQFTGGADLGFWQGPFSSLTDWTLELGFDRNSITGDPLFVDPAGPDGVRGAERFEGLLFEGFDITGVAPGDEFNGVPVVTQIDTIVDVSAGGSYRGLPNDNQAFRWSGEVFLPAAGAYEFIVDSSGPQRLFVDDLVTPLIDDFSSPSNAEQSAVYAAAVPGWVDLAFEVVDDGSTTDPELEWRPAHLAGRRLFLGAIDTRYSDTPPVDGTDDNFNLMSTDGSYHGGAWTADGADSPAIDAGDPADLVFEDTPSGLDPLDPLASQDGDRVNLGAFGNTDFASRSSNAFIQLLSFRGGEKVRQYTASVIQWRSQGIDSMVDIDFVDFSSGGEVVTPIAADVPDAGTYAWNPSIITRQGKIRITGVQSGGGSQPIVAESQSFVVVGQPGSDYYVNDVFDAGTDVYTTAAGDNLNSGTTPGDPMASLNALLSAYDLNPGDTIFIDAGTYNLPTNAVVGAEDSGVRIVGVLGPSATEDPFDSLTVLDRGNTNAGQYALQLIDATDVEIRNLKLTGAEHGLNARNADRLLLQNNIALNNTAIGFQFDQNSPTNDAQIIGNIAIGTTGDANTDQNTGFDLDGSDLTEQGNIAYKIGTQLGTGIHVDNSNRTRVLQNLTFNNVTGLFANIDTDGEVSDNLSRDNDTGIEVDDNNTSDRLQVFGNTSIDNDVYGFRVESGVELYRNIATENATGIFVDSSGSNSLVGTDRFLNTADGGENLVFANSTGILASEGTVQYNRIFGNTGNGIRLDLFSTNVVGNVLYGNSTGIFINTAWEGHTVINNVVYDNTNQGIYVKNSATIGSSGVQLINNTVWHDTGQGILLENNGQNVKLYNNIVFIGGGSGIELLGSTTGFESDFNNVFRNPLNLAGANYGTWKGTVAADLTAWQAVSAEDENSLSIDPEWQNIDGADNLFGWEQPDPLSNFEDFGADDDFQLAAGSPMIDAANSEVAPSVDGAGRTRHDDPGTINTGFGVFRFYDLGALEFQGSSSDITPPTVTNLQPMGLVDGTLTNESISVITVTFSEPMNPVNVQSPTLYVLVNAGADETFDTGDDFAVEIATISYLFGDLDAGIVLSSSLPDGLYRLTLLSRPDKALVDMAGNKLDGDDDPVTDGGDFVRTFRVDVTPPQVVSVEPSGTVTSGPSQFVVTFTDNLFGGTIHMDVPSIENPANYSLISSADDTFGNADDVDISGAILSVSYDGPSQSATVGLAAALASGYYQLTLGPDITDLAGNPLAGGAGHVSTLEVSSIILGDMDGDGDVDFDDIDDLVLGLTNAAGYEALYGVPASLRGDADQDGDLDFDDIDDFVAILINRLFGGEVQAAAQGQKANAGTEESAARTVELRVPTAPARRGFAPRWGIAAALASDGQETTPRRPRLGPSDYLHHQLAAVAEAGNLPDPPVVSAAGRPDGAGRIGVRRRTSRTELTERELASVWSVDQDWLADNRRDWLGGNVSRRDR